MNTISFESSTLFKKFGNDVSGFNHESGSPCQRHIHSMQRRSDNSLTTLKLQLTGHTTVQTNAILLVLYGLLYYTTEVLCVT